MTFVTNFRGYLEDQYLDGQYLQGLADVYGGFQARIVIQDETFIGMQSEINIVDSPVYNGMQGEIQINSDLPLGMQGDVAILDTLNNNGFQGEVTIENTEKYIGMQSQIQIADEPNFVGMQAEIRIANYLDAFGLQASVTILDKLNQNGIQAEIIVEASPASAMQAMINIINSLKSTGMQSSIQIPDRLREMGFEARIDKYPTTVCPGVGGYLEWDYLVEPYLTALWCTRPGMQAYIQIIDYKKSMGMQSEITIVDYPKNNAMQSRITIVDYKAPSAFQADIARISSTAMQSLATIYNTTNLRILCDFKSRGLTATNWSSNSTMAGDFSIQNVDTDIVEQVWRSNSLLVGVRLTTDTGLPQGVFLDTLAILNHNLTRSASVILLGTNDPTFATIGTTITLQARVGNMYYIAPALPTSGYRYWRFDIDDSTNPSTYLEIGTIVFGAASIFQGEQFVDQIDFELKDFADTVRTEGFTNVANSRTQKRRLRLDFQSLRFQKRNFRIMRDMFEYQRTVVKCLWIPTPSATDQEVTARFAAFGKMAVVPTERHNNKGPDNDYVSFTIDIDESL